MNSKRHLILGITFLAVNVNAQFLYMDYASPYNNVYFQKESHMTDRYIHEAVVGDSLIQGESWAKFRRCVTAKMMDSCSPTRTYVNYLHTKEVVINGTPIQYIIGFNPPSTYDSSRIVNIDTVISDEGRTVYCKREQTCVIDSQSYSHCYHVYSSTDSSSYDVYSVEGIGLVKDEQVLNSANPSNSYYYLRKLVQSQVAGIRRKQFQLFKINYRLFQVDGKLFTSRAKKSLIKNFYSFNGH